MEIIYTRGQLFQLRPPSKLHHTRCINSCAQLRFFNLHKSRRRGRRGGLHNRLSARYMSETETFRIPVHVSSYRRPAARPRPPKKVLLPNLSTGLSDSLLVEGIVESINTSLDKLDSSHATSDPGSPLAESSPSKALKIGLSCPHSVLLLSTSRAFTPRKTNSLVWFMQLNLTSSLVARHGSSPQWAKLSSSQQTTLYIGRIGKMATEVFS